jgi:hypothetical protein
MPQSRTGSGGGEGGPVCNLKTCYTKNIPVRAHRLISRKDPALMREDGRLDTSPQPTKEKVYNEHVQEVD